MVPDYSSQDHEKIDALFERRFHGAGNHRGVLYHSLYGCLLGLSLDGSLRSELGTERYEDLEVQAFDGSLSLYQLKCEASKLDYGELEKILRSFAEVILKKSVASCCIVTATGYPPEVENWLVDIRRRSIPAKLKDRINKAANGSARVASLLSQNLQCVTVQTPDLCRQVSHKIAQQVGLTQAAHESFLHSLAFQMQRWSGGRETVSRAMIAKVLSDVKSQFEAGLTNPAVTQGFIVPLSFNADDPGADDFYEGRAARAGHIAARKDVRRAKAHQDLELSLKESNVAAIISSSGQGKSALALRHLSDYTTENFVYEVKVCRTAEDAASIAQFVRFRLQLDAGVSLFIDNLSRAQGAWNDLAGALAGEKVSIIITSREEDWKLFGGDLSRISWKRVTPALELGEARQIFSNLRKSGKLHPSILMADEAYARVSEAKLLIEYVYLLTQGELLEDRLRRQIEDLNGRDPGAVECLRLVSLADQMNLRVEASNLVEMIEFRGDAQLALQKLEGEYLTVQDGLCSGLHPVRSQHLVRLLHSYGIESTLAKLLRLIDERELPEFTYSLLARTGANSESLLQAIVGRISVTNFRAVWEAAYAGSEVRHAQRCLPSLAALEKGVGRAAIDLFPLLTPPFLGGIGVLETLRGIMDAERFEILSEAVRSVPARESAKRFETALATQYAQIADAEMSVDNRLALAKAFWLSGQNEKVIDLLDALRWRETLTTLPPPLALRAAFLAQEAHPKQYASFVRERRDEIVAYLVRETRSLAVEEDGGKLVVSFIVDPYSGERDNDQAVARVQAAKGLLPGYPTYSTKPTRPVELPIPLPYDDAYKDGPSENWHSEEVTSLNKQWTAAMEVVTASDSIVGWEWAQRVAMEAATRIFEDFARFLGKQDEGRNIERTETEACASRISAFEHRKEARRGPPPGLSDEQKTSLKAVDGLFDAASRLLGNILDELLGKDEGEVNRKQVILHVLREVHAISRPAQSALDFVRQRAGLDDGTDFTLKLQNVVEKLYKSIERRAQIERGQARLDSLSSSTALYLQGKLKEADAGLARRVRLADKSLLYTPGNEASRFDMPSWFFTIEVEDLADFVADALTVCMVFAEVFDSFWGNFIAVPVRQGSRVSPRVYRALAPVLRDVVAGKEPESLILWPMDDSGDLPNLLFGIRPHQSRPELDLVQPFLETGEKLAYAKAASLIEERIPGAPPFFTGLIASERLAEKFRDALGALKTYVPPVPLRAAWNEVLDALEENAATLDQAPDQFLVKNGRLAEPMDRYLAATLA